MSLAMSKEERESFLAATRIGIVSIAEADRGPVTVPVWYQYEPGGEVLFVTGGDSKKAHVLEHVSRASFCVQTEAAPYSYVSVEGPVSTGPADYSRHIEEMAVRYLGPEMGAAYLAATHPNEEMSGSVLVTIKPRRWWSVDYSKM